MAVTNTAQSVFTVIIKGPTGEIVMDNDDIKDIYFIEDIFSYLMTGRMMARDTRGIVEFLPLVGNETITIEYGSVETGTPGDSYLIKEQTFDIIKVNTIESTGDKHRHFLEFFFIAAPHKRLHMEHYSKSYKCMMYTDYIADILESHCGMSPGQFMNFEMGNEILQYFYTGLKTPAQNIEWLSSRSSGMTSGQPGYLLYSNTLDPDKPYNFITLEQLLSQGSQMPPYGGSYSIGSHHEYNINRILHYSDGRVDKRALERMMYFINLGYDIKRKRYLKNEYKYKEGLDRFTCLGNFSLFDSGNDEILSASQELTCEAEEEFIMKNLYWGDWIKRYCLQHLVDVIIEGHVERHCGGMIEVMWPSASDDSIYDKNMNGNFLVKSITHHFVPIQKPVYTQKMVLIKNGYADSDGILTAAGKVNNKLVQLYESPYVSKVRGL